MYRKDLEERFEALNSSKNGLTTEEAKNRLKKYGMNELVEEDRESLIVKFFQNFTDVMVMVLIGAAVISALLREFTDAVIILVIVVINATISTIQEAKAQNALDALKKMSTPYSIVLRDGAKKNIHSNELVPGDVVLLETGNIVPADGRLISGSNLQIEESALTGESVPVEKDENFSTTENIPIGDRINMVFSSTIVTYGRGSFLVTNTGMDTEIGKIAFMIMQEDTKQTPLQRRLAKIGQILAAIVLLLAAGIFALGLIQKQPIAEMFLTAVSIAVAAIPEGLPAVVTIVLALGVQRLSRKNAVIKNLPAVETLGSASVICSDKTGTLTQNKMKVKKVFMLNDDNSDLIRGFALCNDAEFNDEMEIGVGDPTEVALIEFAHELGFDKEKVEDDYPRINEIPFDSTRKMMSTVHKHLDQYIQYTKGGTDEVLSRCTHIRDDEGIRLITTEDKLLISQKNEEYAKDALRVLSLAMKESSDSSDLLVEQELTFLGLLGMMDPPRDTSKSSIRTAKLAGIIPVMITGDHLVTATSIAHEIGIIDDVHETVTGRELEMMSDEELNSRVDNIRVYARVAPEHKVRIVNAWQSKGHVVAMTGDGVNDAPALKRADIGVAMGVVGSDVSRNSADLVLMDDNFSTIVTAVAEGRGIYDNIQRTVRFLLSCNFGEVILILLGMITKLGIPLLPVHILWVNLVTDSLPALALGVEGHEKNIMTRPPRNANEGLLTSKSFALTVFEGLVIGLVAFAAFRLGMNTSMQVARTMAFVTIALAQLVQAFNMRSTSTLFSKGFFSNKAFLLAIGVSLVLQLAVVLIPFFSKIFHTAPLDLNQWLICLGLSFMPFVVTELRKVVIKE